MCVCSHAHTYEFRCQKRPEASVPLELELQIGEAHDVGAGNRT